MNAPNPEPAALPMGLRERVMAASLLARGAGQPVPAVPEISGAEAFGRAAARSTDCCAPWTRRTGRSRPCAASTSRAWSAT